MPDDRSLTEKLEAMANQTVSPNEAEVARLMLERLQARAGRAKSTGALSREDILAAPDRDSPAASVRVYHRGMWYVLDEDDEIILENGDVLQTTRTVRWDL